MTELLYQISFSGSIPLDNFHNRFQFVNDCFDSIRTNLQLRLSLISVFVFQEPHSGSRDHSIPAHPAGFLPPSYTLANSSKQCSNFMVTCKSHCLTRAVAS